MSGHGPRAGAMLPTELSGKYEERGALGAGAMGSVVEAFDRMIERRVAVKLVRLPSGGDAEDLEAHARFRREAQAAGRLSHPNIVGVYDYGENADTAWIVMELVEGGSLKAILDRAERMPVAEIVRVMDEVLAALAYSHGRGVVHRDIKPANIMLAADRSVKIADFGIARIENSSMTQVGTVMGTPSYMAPEQLRGEPVDARADIWAAGVVLYQLLTGEKPFEGNYTALMHRVLNTEPLPPSQLAVSVPAAFDQVIAHALAKRPSDRFASASAFAEAIRAAGRATGAVPATEATGSFGFAGAGPLPGLDDATMVAGGTRGPMPAPKPPMPAAPATPGPAAPAGGGGSKAPLLIGGGLAVLVAAGAAFFLLQPAPPPAVVAVAPSTVSPPAPPPPGPPAQTTPLQTAPVQTAPSVPQPPAPSVAPAPTVQMPPSPPPSGPAPLSPPFFVVPTPQPQVPQPPAPSLGVLAPPASVPAAPPALPAAPMLATPVPGPIATPAPFTPPPAPVQPAPSQPAQAPQPQPQPQQQAALPTPAPMPAPAPTPAPIVAPVAPRIDFRAAAQAATSSAPCSLLAGAGTDSALTVTGVMRRGGDAALRRVLTERGVPPQAATLRVQSFEGPYCGMLDVLRQVAVGVDEAPRVDLVGTMPLQLGDLLRLDVQMPDRAGYLYVSYVMKSNEIVHLVPSQPQGAGARLRLGDPRAGFAGWEVDEPFGTDLIVVFASERPLFPQPRPVIEPVDDYIAALGIALRDARTQRSRVTARAIVVETVQKR